MSTLHKDHRDVLIAPVVSRLLAMAVSRKREFLADATAAQFTRHPEALARALHPEVFR